jgi:16S rRNA (guanine966-N2)-methyltransferase
MRITGGTLRSRSLIAPRGQATRPTSDRVREALFGILSSAGALEGARVLDLYAGTGALSFEALSRGASHATLVESSREALAAIRENARALGLADRVRVIPSDAGAAARRLARQAPPSPGAPFDLVFADPPWALVDSGAALGAIASFVRAQLEGATDAGGVGGTGAPMISPDATIVLEHATRTPPPELDATTKVDTRLYGDTALSFYKPAILGPPRAAMKARSPSE